MAVAQFRWIDACPVNDANTVSNWASRFVDVRLAFPRRWHNVSLRPFLGIDNLFDERYNGSTVPNALGDRYFEPAPGRQIYGGAALDLGVRRPTREGDTVVPKREPLSARVDRPGR